MLKRILDPVLAVCQTLPDSQCVGPTKIAATPFPDCAAGACAGFHMISTLNNACECCRETTSTTVTATGITTFVVNGSPETCNFAGFVGGMG